MQFQTLTNAIFSIEKMAKMEGKQDQLLIELHKMSRMLASVSKTHESIIEQNKQSEKECKQLRKKLKKTSGKLEKKQEECEQLKRELVSTRDMYEHKLQKLMKRSESKQSQDVTTVERRRQRREERSKKGRETQCQILNGSLVKELQERNLCLLRKNDRLEKELEEQKNQNNSKQLYIESLISALESQVEKDVQEEEEEEEHSSGGARSTCHDFNDNSTLDADSLKDQDRQSEFFPQGERRDWHEHEPEGTPQPEETWYGPFLKVFRSAKSLLWRE